MKSWSINLMICVILTGLPYGAFPQTNRFTLAELAKITKITDPQISPDGKSVVIVVSRPNLPEKRYDSELVLIEVATGNQRILTRERRGVSWPRWSPSGDRLAFLARSDTGKDANVQLFVMPMAGGDALRLSGATNGVQHFAWRPDGKDIAFVTSDEPTNKEQITRGEDGFEVGNDSYLTTTATTPSHIWLVSTDGGPARRLTSGSWSVGTGVSGAPTIPLSWSADGQTIAFTRQATPHAGDTDLITVNLLDVSSGKIHPLTQHTVNEGWPMFSPDGSWIAYSYWQDGLDVSVAEIHIIPTAGGTDRYVTQPLDRNFRTALWMRDVKALLLVANDGVRVSAWLQPVDGPGHRLNLGNLNVDGGIGAGKDGSIVVVASEPHEAGELYYLSSPDAAPRQLTRFNESTANLNLGRAEEVKWEGPDGWNEDGVLIYPPDFLPGKKYPLVLRIHGGPESASNETFDKLAQFIAAHDYLVFSPNYRGSDNLGNAFQMAISNDAGNGPSRDVMAGIEAVEKLGIVDTNRIAVSGWSYGGYMTAWLLGHYSIWKAAVAGAAMTDWMDDYSIADCNVQDRYAFAGRSPWTGDLAKAYVEQSPITYATNIHAPTLILCDTGDFRVPITQSYKLYHALRDIGVETKFIAYPTSGHWPADPVRSADIYKRWVEWLDEHLK